MQINADKSQVFCHVCKEWEDLNTGTIWLLRLDDVMEIKCLHCDTLLGYDYDLDL